MEIEKKDFSQMRDFADNAGVDTRTKIKALGNIPPEREAITCAIRMPKDTEAWLNDRVKGNKSLAIAAMMDYSIAQIEKEIQKTGTFNVKKWLKICD